MTTTDDNELHGIFVSTPISAFATNDLIAFKTFCIDLKNKLLLLHKRFSFYCATVAIEEPHLFDSPEDSANRDFEALRRIDSFVLLYPKPLPSSSLIELGYALALRKRILIIAPSMVDIPFLARGLTKTIHNTEIFLADPIDDQSSSRIVEFCSRFR